MIRVLHLRSSAGMAGPERHLLELVPALTNEGVEAEVATLYRRSADGPETHPLAAEAEGIGVAVQVLDDPRRWPSGALHRLDHRLEKQPFDILHSHDYKSNLVARRLTRRRSITTVATVHLHTRSDWKLRLYRWLDRVFLRRFDAIILVSETLTKEIPHRATTAIANGIDTEAWRRRAGEGTDLRSELGLTEKDRLLLAIGRLAYQKGFDLLLEALALIAPDVKLAIVGEGPEEDALRRLASDLSLDDRVFWLGSRPDPAPLYPTADAVILPSRREGLPYVLLEALAVGRPVIASRVGGIPEVVKDGDEGLLVPSEDVDALGQAIRRLLANPQEATAFGARGRVRVDQHFSAAVMARRTAEVYRTALGQAALDQRLQ